MDVDNAKNRQRLKGKGSICQGKVVSIEAAQAMLCCAKLCTNVSSMAQGGPLMPRQASTTSTISTQDPPARPRHSALGKVREREREKILVISFLSLSSFSSSLISF